MNLAKLDYNNECKYNIRIFSRSKFISFYLKHDFEEMS